MGTVQCGTTPFEIDDDVLRRFAVVAVGQLDAIDLDAPWIEDRRCHRDRLLTLIRVLDEGSGRCVARQPTRDRARARVVRAARTARARAGRRRRDRRGDRDRRPTTISICGSARAYARLTPDVGLSARRRRSRERGAGRP